MKNIETILSELGINIPEDKAEEFKKTFSENYKTVAEVNKKAEKITDLEGQLQTAKDAIAKFGDLNPEDYQKNINDLKKQLEDAEKDYKDNLYKRDLSDALDRELSKLRFTSETARKGIREELLKSGITFKENRLYGFQDHINELREKDASAFVDEAAEKAEKDKVQFTNPKKTSTPTTITRDDIMKEPDREKRRQLIKENKHLFE